MNTAALLVLSAAAGLAAAHAGRTEVRSVRTATERWGIAEIELKGPAHGNPFVEVRLSARLTLGSTSFTVDGFYDGEGVYRVRFMPPEIGQWQYATESNRSELSGKSGTIVCGPPARDNHGPVRVHKEHHFVYADGTPHVSVGTTCYAWAHQGDDLEEQTLSTLRTAPFNKVRMCVFPKDYTFNKNEPQLYPFEGDPPRNWDFMRPNPAFFRRFEMRVKQLRDLGIEADIILFHPYDRWGFVGMSPEQDSLYLRYVVSRLAAYRNVWWSMANEFDFMKTKTDADWDRMFQIVQRHDPYDHLRSIHNGARFYDHSRPWVTHCSVQSGAMESGKDLRRRYDKPVTFDEVCYEGNIEDPWGNITAEELVHRFWRGTIAGSYVGHGETYVHPKDVLWWSKGGVLHGRSAARIAFLRKVLEDAPHGLDPIDGNWKWQDRVAGREGDYYLFYFGPHQPSAWMLPAGGPWMVDVLDTWNMTIAPVKGTLAGGAAAPMPGKPWMALRVRRANVDLRE